MHVNEIRSKLIIILFFLIALAACEKEREKPFPDPVHFVESELIASFKSDDILTLLNDLGELPQQISFFILYDVLVYRIIYETIDVDNKPVLASGALVVPDIRDPMPLMSFQHGTITEEEDAPSWFSSDIYLTAVLNASAGYIIALPDYLGFGSSRHLDHPYEHGRSLATASMDMLRAVREFDILNNEFRANDKLFLTGYSQGGYATMALLKLLEEVHSDEFRVTAATAGAGAYNKSEFARYIIGVDEEIVYLNTFLWVLDTYNKVYGIERPYSHYFNEPYATIIAEGGVFDNPELNPQDLFTGSFSEGIITGSDTEFISALADNDNYDWKPSTPLQLYHGTDDDFVYYFNSASAYQAMNQRGAESVELITIQGGNHATSVTNYFLGTFLFFSQF